MQISYDARIPLARKVLGIIVPKTFLSDIENSNPDIMITKDNIIIAIVLDTTIYCCKLNTHEIGNDIGFKYSSIISENESSESFIYDKYVLKKVSDCFYGYFNISINNQALASRDNLKEDPDFQKYLSLKAADGMKFYKLPGNDIYNPTFYHIPIISGFPVLTKSDNIGIKVFDLSNGYLLTVFDIYKKKLNCNYQMYFRTLLLN